MTEESMIDELDDYLVRLSEPDWDSFGALPICPQSVEMAKRLAPVLPTGFWWVAPMTDGNIMFESENYFIQVRYVGDDRP